MSNERERELDRERGRRYRARVIGDMPAALAAAAGRFWSFVDRRGADECWPWLGSNDGHHGYGGFCLTGDNPPCCNPNHLFAGSHADNAADRQAKNRNPGRGRSKITDEQAASIRIDSRKHREIAAEYGISRPHVTRIKGEY